jgi:hypothetical protein
MTVLYIFDIRYMCSLDVDGSTILNPYTPISFD